jgi:hypothetical protein
MTHEDSTMKLYSLLVAGAAALATATGVHAGTVALGVGVWQTFDVVDPIYGFGNNDLSWIDINDGSKLSFTFTIHAGEIGHLTVVDGAFSGDVFSVTSNGSALTNTSAATDSYPHSIGLDFDAALMTSGFSQGTYTFTAGSYEVTGALARSALDDTGTALNSTVGAVQLQIPEPTSLALLLAAGGAMTLAGRRRAV